MPRVVPDQERLSLVFSIKNHEKEDGPKMGFGLGDNKFSFLVVALHTGSRNENSIVRI